MKMFPPLERKSTIQKKVEKEKVLEEEKRITRVLKSAREVEIYVTHTKSEALEAQTRFDTLQEGCANISRSFEEAQQRVSTSAGRRLD